MFERHGGPSYSAMMRGWRSYIVKVEEVVLTQYMRDESGVGRCGCSVQDGKKLAADVAVYILKRRVADLVKKSVSS